MTAAPKSVLIKMILPNIKEKMGAGIIPYLNIIISIHMFSNSLSLNTTLNYS